MVAISIDEIGRDPLGYLRRVEAGETLLIVRGERSVAEIKPVEPRSEGKSPRPAGLSAGEFTVPDDFDDPLPEEVLRGFEGRWGSFFDTHIFLWYISGDSKLPANLRDSIRDPGDEVYVSVVSVWEAVIKHKLGKLPLPEPAEDHLPEQRERHMISSLTLDEPSVARLGSLPPLHRDPFDRMLVCQALQHGLVMATVDGSIREYPVTVL